jgi:hypothetical protein
VSSGANNTGRSNAGTAQEGRQGDAPCMYQLIMLRLILSISSMLDHFDLAKAVLGHFDLVKPVLDHFDLVSMLDHFDLAKPMLDHFDLAIA